MNKFLCIIIFLSHLFYKTSAQDYHISFTGSGEHTDVEQVEVKNLTQGTSLSLQGCDVLHLTWAQNTDNKLVAENVLRVYPNPVNSYSKLELKVNKTGMVHIEIFDMTARLVAYCLSSVAKGIHVFSISGLKAGIYTVRVTSPCGFYAVQIQALGNTYEVPVIKYVNGTPLSETEDTPQKNKNLVPMQYNHGDRLLFKGMSETYTRVIVMEPTASQTIDFNFVDCTDADSNHYAVVTIGTQTWMAENLKTTKYKDGTLIAHLTDNTAWSMQTNGAYCWQANNENAYKDIYGALYNWFAVNNGDLCPDGWHVPTDNELGIMEAYLIANAYNYDGTTSGNKIAKALSGTDFWISATNIGAIGNNLSLNNSSGFTALPGGFRYGHSGLFGYTGNFAYWWTSSNVSSELAMSYNLNKNLVALFRDDIYKTYGASVRCIKN